MYIVIAVVIVAFVGMRLASLATVREEGTLMVLPARQGKLQDNIYTSGTVLGEEVKVIYAPVTGTLAEVYVKAGNAVKAGDKLIGYDVEKTKKRLRQSMALVQAETEYVLAKQGIVAGFDGIVTECMVNPGSPVTEGMQLLTLESSSNLKVSFQVSQHDALRLEPGQKADVEIAGRVYPGEVSRISHMAVKSESSAPLVGAEIHLLETDDAIILGLDAGLTIYTGQGM